MSYYFLWHSQGCTLDFLSDVRLGRMGMEKLFAVIPLTVYVIHFVLLSLRLLIVINIFRLKTRYATSLAHIVLYLHLKNTTSPEMLV